jgi:hypothetical protein
MKPYRRLLFCSGVLLAIGASGCGSGSIGDLQADGSVQADGAVVSCPDSEPVTVYRDSDGDGFGDPGQPMSVCGSLAGYVSDSSDCHDGDALVNPDSAEVCGDYVDNDCDGIEPCLASLLAHWPLNDGSGSIAGDASGHEHDGSLRNAPQWSSEGPHLHFDGGERYVEVPHDPAFLVDEGTVALWFRVDELSLQHGLWSKDSSGLDTGGHLTIHTTVEVPDTTPARVRVRLQHADSTVGSSGSFTLNSPAIEARRWYHVAFVFGPEGMRLHLDSTPVASNVYTGGLGETAGGIGNHEPIVIGASAATSGDLVALPISTPHMGDIYDVRFYGRALRTDELSQIYELTRPGAWSNP